MSLRELAGNLVGKLVAPAFVAAARLRDGRAVHRHGVLHRGYARPLAHEDPALAALSMRLQGPVLLRFSAALFDAERAPDVLGLAMRFCSAGAPDAAPSACDQDLVLATTPGVLRLPVALARTDVHDWLANRYYGALSFDVDGVGRVKLRATPVGTRGREGREGGREERLELAALLGDARIMLELRRRGRAQWSPISVIDVGERLEDDPWDLRFVPFLDACGIRPVGFVHALRGATYAASAATRQEHRRARAPSFA